MDIISHGLYGGVAFGRRSRVSYAKAFFFGIMPDLLSFGIFTVLMFLGVSAGPQDFGHPPDADSIPEYVYALYNVTHSLVVAGVSLGIVWFLFKKPVYEMLAWPLHILVDIPTHSTAFFPTPFLWPLSNFYVNGVSWGHPYIFFPNIIILICMYAAWFIRRRKRVN
jgi:hypothetical protein